MLPPPRSEPCLKRSGRRTLLPRQPPPTCSRLPAKRRRAPRLAGRVARLAMELVRTRRSIVLYRPTILRLRTQRRRLRQSGRGTGATWSCQSSGSSCFCYLQSLQLQVKWPATLQCCLWDDQATGVEVIWKRGSRCIAHLARCALESMSWSEGRSALDDGVPRRPFSVRR